MEQIFHHYVTHSFERF